MFYQSDRKESLQCPANSKRVDAGSGNKSLASNLQKFNELYPNSLDVRIDLLDGGNGIEKCLMGNCACWHKSVVLSNITIQSSKEQRSVSPMPLLMKQGMNTPKGRK